MTADVVVIGGGFAGLCAAERIAAAGMGVTLLEQEPICAAHASGRNAAIWLPLGELASTGALATATAARMRGWLGDAWLRPSGALVTANDGAELERLLGAAPAAGVRATRVSAEEAARLCPALRGGSAVGALVVEGAGEMDIHAMTTAAAERARAHGATIRLRARVARVEVRGARVTGVVLEDGSGLAAGAVILAAGAWAGALGAEAGAPVPLTPLRRHLAQLTVPEGVDVGTRVVWHSDPEVYFRPEVSTGILASPCDELAFEPGVPPTDPEVLRRLATRLRMLAPALNEARVVRSWACLRTFAPDRELVIGEDPRVAGLHWMTGLGGRGMTVAAGAAELLAEGLRAEKSSSIPPSLHPSRFVG